MIYNTSHDQRRNRIEQTNLSCPFYRMCLSCGCGKCADTRNIKADGKDKSKSLCFGKVCRQDGRNICGTTGGFCTKSRTYKNTLYTIHIIKSMNRKMERMPSTKEAIITAKYNTLMITSQSNEIRSGCVPIEARKVLRTDASGTGMAEAIPEMIPANIMASRKKKKSGR